MLHCELLAAAGRRLLLFVEVVDVKRWQTVLRLIRQLRGVGFVFIKLHCALDCADSLFLFGRVELGFGTSHRVFCCFEVAN